jgi:hypothetical protein
MLQQLLRDVVALQDRSGVAMHVRKWQEVVLILAGPGRQRHAALILAVEVKTVNKTVQPGTGEKSQ